ncbi:hypothetical protein [Paenisporosarcina cavernae]|uniref:Uncharacterized protein n=1 Tax=Paenisporosarcina cavernae TaxID=2320858 RepID=A0A385YU12_9BACL|nr:hypothetical protein [Paenisporosarcina cavernae]AYC30166.1 hypothetical protein D3873_09890 [Paenisporosarcina cavernae]
MGLLGIFMWLIGLVITYFVIYLAVKDAINKSDIAKILVAKYEMEKPKPIVTADEIESEFEKDDTTR